MEGQITRGTPADKKVEPDYKYDERALVSKQKKLKLVLQKCIQDNTIVDFSAVKHKGQLYQVGSYIELWDITLKKPFVGRLLRIVQGPSNLQAVPFIEIQWCLKKEDLPEEILTVYGNHISVAEVFPSDIKYCLYVEGIKRKCSVLSIQDYGQMTASFDDIYFSRSHLENEKLVPSPLEWKRTCYCDAPENPDRPYVMCEKCESWFHLDCISGLNTQEDSFVCSGCDQDLQVVSSFSHN